MNVSFRCLLAGLCAVLYASVPAAAQTGPAEPTPWRAFRSFTRDSGSRALPQSTVTAVHEDREGVIWVLTLDGIARIEHAEVERLSPSPDAPLSGPYYAITEHRSGGIHVSGDDAVATWNGATWSRIPTPVTLISLAEDGAERLLGVDRLGSVWEYASDRRWAKLTREGDPPSVAVAATGGGAVFAAGAGGVREVTTTLAAPRAPLSSPVIALYIARGDDVWAATEDGRVQVLVPGSTRWIPQPIDGWDGGVIHAISEDAAGRIWIGGERGRVAFGGSGTRFRIWTPANGVAAATVNAIAADRTGGVWFGFSGFGLQQWLGDAWSHRTFWIDPRESERLTAQGLTRTASGFVAAVRGHGIWRWNGRTMEAFGAEHGLTEDVRIAVEPTPGVIWAGTRRGLFESRDGGRFARVFSLSVSAGAVNGLFESPDGTWWAVTENGGVFVQGGAGWHPHLPLNAKLPDVNVRQIAWRRNGELWIATASGIAAYRGPALDPVPLPGGPSSIASPYALVEHDGAMWVGGATGLAIFANGAWTSPTNAVPGSHIAALASGTDGSVWVGGSEGIVRVKDGQWTKFDATNGLISEETTPLGLVVLPSGDVYAGTMSGLSHFSAAQAVLPAPALRLFWRLDAVRFAGRPVTLPAEERGVTLQWRAPWPRPIAMEYRTRIPRLNERWSPPQAASELRIENLLAGDWNIEVSARLPGSGESGWSEPLIAALTVPPNWYETLTARLAGVGLLGVGLAAVVRWRTGRLRRRAMQLERAVQRELARVKILRGLLPICAFCKKIRDDGGYWNQLEEFIAENSQADFSHGLCPDCIESEYPELQGK